MRRALRVALFLTAVAFAGCGPIEYVNQVTRNASTAVEAAKAVDADKYAPYWYTLAVEYLHRARVEAAESDFQAANRFGRKAERAAETARREALRFAGDPAAMRREGPMLDGPPEAGEPALDDPAALDDELPPAPGETP